jgi:hypothetical protein
MAKSLGFAPIMLGTMLTSVALPVLESVAASADEVVPTVVLGKFSGELSEATGADAALIEIEVLVTLDSPGAPANSV